VKTPYGIYLPGKAEPERRDVDWPHDPGYDRIRDLIRPLLDGGKLEHVTVLHNGKPADMFVDEDFQDKGLPRNDAATAIYRAYSLKCQPGTDPETLPAIAGPAIIFERRVWL
jgi:GNAT superfamily N-acetyltransferase